MKRVAWFTAIVLAILLVVVLLWQFRGVLGLFILSLVVAATARPLIDRMVVRGIPTGLALLAVYLAGVTFFVFLMIAISQPLSLELQRMANDFTINYERVVTIWPQGGMLQQMIAAQLPTTGELLEQLTGAQGFTLAETALGVTLSVADIISHLFLVLVLSLYWSSDRVRFERLWLSLLPSAQRVRARTLWRNVEAGLGSYIRSELVQSLLAVLVLSVAYTLIGLQYPVALALVGAVLWLIPLVGGLLVLVMVAAVGLLSSPFIALVATAITLAVLVVLELFVEPKLFDRKVYNPILVLLVMIAMTDAFGLLGLVAAPPLAVAIQISLYELVNPAASIAAGVPSVAAQPTSTQVMPQVIKLRDRLTTARQLLFRMEEPSPRLVSMLERLEGLIDELGPIMAEEQAEGRPQ